MLNDLSYAFRTLRKSPIFTITVVVTIALAIGASTAIFSVTNGVLLRQLPYKDPERLVLARSDLQRTERQRLSSFNCRLPRPAQRRKKQFRGFRGRQHVSLHASWFGRYAGADPSGAVSTNFFQMMGGSIVAGRDFQESDGTPSLLRQRRRPAMLPQITPDHLPYQTWLF
jgi:putative ABC transport system permease protein